MMQFYTSYCYLQAKILKLKLILALKDYSSVISEAGYILKEDEDNLEALLLRGRAYYYLSDHDVASRFVFRIMSEELSFMDLIVDECYTSGIIKRDFV